MAALSDWFVDEQTFGKMQRTRDIFFIAPACSAAGTLGLAEEAR
jgi:hypothetical protein